MKQTIIIITLLLFTFTNAFSHPHTFIEVEPTIKIKDKKIAKLNVKWTIDEMTSMMLIMELDSNGNGKFEKDENNYIYENYFASLQKQNFYMKIDSNKQKLVINPKNFKASIKENKLVYSFDIEKSLDIKNLKIDFFDKELFVGLMLKKEYIKLVGIDNKKSNLLKKEIFGVN